MKQFQKAYTELLNSIETRYKIELTLGEKLAIKECLFVSQRAKGKRLTNLVGEFSKKSAEYMWLRQYGIYTPNLGKCKPDSKYYDFVREARERSILI